MSGLEVVAAVSAVISAFHGGSELLKHIKKKRRRSRSRDQAQQDFEERQLQDSLDTGEQQIGLRYASDMKELGELVRIGDATAYHRLQNIAIIMQAEIIKSLQLAAQYDNAILNLKILHETSIMNRKDTFVTLDELKQRILITRPPRSLEGVPDALRHTLSTPSVYTLRSSSYSSVPDNYVPSGVFLPTHGDSKESRSGLARYFQLKRNNSESSIASTQSHPSSPPNANFSAALEQLVNARGTEDRARIMSDIDDIITSYQQLNMSHGPVDPWGGSNISSGSSGSYDGSRRDTLAILNGGYAPKRDTMGLQRDAMQLLRNLPPTQEEHYVERAPEYHNNLNPHHERHILQPLYTAPNPLHQLQTQGQHQPRWSSASGASSSGFSDTPPSLYRNNSTSSDGSHRQTSPIPSDVSPVGGMGAEYARFPPSPSFSINNTTHPLDEHRGIGSHLQPQAPFVAPEHSHSPPRAPIAHNAQADSTARAPSYPLTQAGTSAQAPYPHLPPAPIYPLNVPQIKKEEDSTQSSRNYETIGPDSISTHSNSTGRTVIKSIAQATAAASSAALAPAIGKPLQHAPTTHSIASTDSSGSFSIHPISNRPPVAISTGSIQGPPTGRERMMIGRPNRDNGYWGFCKGAWAAREENKKGLVLQNEPAGMYNTRQIWECRQCHFRGEAHNVPHPKKKNKTETIVDPSIHTASSSGIRYRWIFLAKSHVKKKDNAVLRSSLTNDANFGCLVCSVQGRVTGVYGNVETLMNHIILEHAADMDQKTQALSRCIVGRVAEPKEDWDFNIPSLDALDG